MHADKHPTFVDDCFACKVRSVNISATAMPTRKPVVIRNAAADSRLDADLDAYKRLRNHGLQPKNIDGSADMERKGTTREEIELGHLFPDKARRDMAREAVAQANELRDSGAVPTGPVAPMAVAA